MNTNLTEQEIKFCQLFVHGSGDEVGDAIACYKKAFDCGDYKAINHYQDLIKRKDIQDYINDLECPEDLESFQERHLRHKVTKKLLHIAEECSNQTYSDRRGNAISPAAMRSVAVHAYKIIADINGISKKKDIAENGDNGSQGGSGITFNVIVPPTGDSSGVDVEEVK